MDEKLKRALDEAMTGLARFPNKPTEKLWNKTAKKYNYLSSKTLKIITNLEWEDLYYYVKSRKKNEQL